MLSIYLPDKGFWQGVQVTDKADIDALLKNAVHIDVMNLYGSKCDGVRHHGAVRQLQRDRVL